MGKQKCSKSCCLVGPSGLRGPEGPPGRDGRDGRDGINCFSVEVGGKVTSSHISVIDLSGGGNIMLLSGNSSVDFQQGVTTNQYLFSDDPRQPVTFGAVQYLTGGCTWDLNGFFTVPSDGRYVVTWNLAVTTYPSEEFPIVYPDSFAAQVRVSDAFDLPIMTTALDIVSGTPTSFQNFPNSNIPDLGIITLSGTDILNLYKDYKVELDVKSIKNMLPQASDTYVFGSIEVITNSETVYTIASDFAISKVMPNQV